MWGVSESFLFIYFFFKNNNIFSFYRGTPVIANKNIMHSKTATRHMQTFHTYIISNSHSS